jgi:hypothetical protein
MASLIKSGLEEAIKNLPEEAAIKAESLPNVLKKAGVKDEELKWSGVELPKEGKVTKKQLAEMERARKDVFGVDESNSQYKGYSLANGQNNPTYKERVYTFKQGKGGDSRYNTDHFSDTDDYLYHTRTFRDSLNGKDTHVIQELQSDLHQQARQAGGYITDTKPVSEQELERAELLIEAHNSGDKFALSDLADFAVDLDLPVNTGEPNEVLAVFNELIRTKAISASDIPKSPYEKDWLKKAIEREISNAIDEGAQQVAIPIDGTGLDSLQRGAGVQQWYNTTVLDTARKIAKQNGMEFEEVTQPAKREGYDYAGNKLAEQLTDALLKPNPQQPVQDRVKKTLEVAAFDLPEEEQAKVIALAEDYVAKRRAEGKHISTPELAKKIQELIKYDQNGTRFAVIRPAGGAVFDASEESIRSAMLSGPNPAEAIKSLGFTSKDIMEALPANSATLMQAVQEAPEELIKGLQDKAAGKTGLKLPSFSLYSSAGAGIASVYMALKQGYTQEEVRKQLEEREYNQEEIDGMFAKIEKMQRAEEMGYPVKQIFAQIEKEEPKAEAVKVEPASKLQLHDDQSKLGKAYTALVGPEEMNAKELVAKLQVIGESKSTITEDLMDYAGDQQGIRTKEQLALASEERIKAMSVKYGLELEVVDGEYWAKTPDGPVKVEPDFWQSFWESKGEFVLGTGGAIAGGIAGAKIGGAMSPPTPWTKAAGIIAGSTLGAAIGSAGGTELDYLHNAIVMNEDMNAEVAARKALSSAEMSVIADLATLGTFKLGKSSWKGIVKAKDFIQNGMFNRARTALKEQLFITDEAADELVEKLARVADVQVKSKTDKQIVAATLTKPGGESIVRASGSIDPKASAAVANAIDIRAKDLLDATNKISSDNVGSLMKNELTAYETAVKENFGRVKSIAAQQPRVNNVKFKYDQLMIEPVLERLSKNIENPDVAYKFMAQAQRIRDMSSTRGFTDLLELRQLVNDFKFNKRITSAKDFKMLDEVLGRIDGTIKQSAGYVFEDPKAWLDEYKLANSQYAKMMSLRKNAIMKVANKPGVSDKAVAQALTKYSTSVDDTFHEVIQSMPRTARTKVEGSVIDVLANKYTAGREGGMRATHFPMLAKELNNITFTTPEARVTKKAILELADVFMNDVPLAQSTGNIQLPKFQSFLTADPVLRAKYEIASGLFNRIKQAVYPTSAARTQSLIRRAAKVLENPINSKSIKELKEELGPQMNIDKDLEKLAIEFARQKAAGGGMPRVKLYGDGKILSATAKGAEHSIPLHRIATTDVVSELAESLGINKADKKSIDAALRDRGYKAIQLGTNSVRVID